MENYARLTKEEKSLYWKNHFDLWKESGLSQKKYCKNNSVSYWNFKSWYEKTKSRTDIETKNFIRLETDKITNESSGKFEVVFPCGTRINIDVNISELNFRKILSAAGCVNG